MKKPRKHGAASASANVDDNRTEFLNITWTGPKARDFFFGLNSQPAFQGVGKDAVVLPAHMLSISAHPWTGGAVAAAFPNGLAFADQVSQMTGATSVGALINLPLLVFGAWHAVTAKHFDAMIALSLFLCIPIALLIFLLLRFDVTGYRSAPTLFDRAAGRVHVFVDGTRLLGWWPLWGGGAYEIRSYDWRCVRAQVSRFRTFTGNVSQDNAVLTGVAIASPDDATVVGQFGIGTTVDANNLQVLLDRWEHIRRFMEHEGPLFVAGDGPGETPWTESLLGALFWGQPMLGPGSAVYRRPLHWQMLLIQAILLPLLPLSMLFGTIRWCVYQLKSKPHWPPEILASVGGQVLKGQALQAWSNIIPSRPAPPVAYQITSPDEASNGIRRTTD